MLLYLIGDRAFIAGSGSILAMLQTASHRTPDVICGKPHKALFDVLVDKYHIDPKKTLMIGDRLVCSSLVIYCSSSQCASCRKRAGGSMEFAI